MVHCKCMLRIYSFSVFHCGHHEEAAPSCTPTKPPLRKAVHTHTHTTTHTMVEWSRCTLGSAQSERPCQLNVSVGLQQESETRPACVQITVPSLLASGSVHAESPAYSTAKSWCETAWPALLPRKSPAVVLQRYNIMLSFSIVLTALASWTLNALKAKNIKVPLEHVKKI